MGVKKSKVEEKVQATETTKQLSTIEQQGEQIVKKTTGRGGTHNFPTTIKGTRKEDVQRIGANLMKWYKMPKVENEDELAERLEWFFTECIENGEILTVEKMCLAIGFPRQTVYRWESGQEGSTPRKRDLIKRAKELLASFDAEMVTEGKINPITYIFRAKNYFGMQDKQEYVLTPNNPLGETKDPDEIHRRLSAGLADD